MTVSNCILWSRRRYAELMAAWRAAGYPEGQEPYKVERASRLAPKWVPHTLVGQWRDCAHCGGGVQVESFKPLDTRKLRWRDLWRVILFRGRVVSGDKP